MSIKDSEKLPCNCILWPVSSTTIAPATTGNIHNYCSITAKTNSRLNAVSFLLFLCFGGFFATSQAVMRGCWVLRGWLPRRCVEWDALLVVLSYFLRYVTPGSALIGDVSRWSFTKAGKKAAHFMSWERRRGRGAVSFFLLSWAINRNMKTEAALKNGKFPKH